MYSTTSPLNFEVSSGQLFVADPVYTERTDGGILENVKNGTWHAVAVLDGCANVALLAAYHSSENVDFDRDTFPLGTEVREFSICVDTATAGIFDQGEHAKTVARDPEAIHNAVLVTLETTRSPIDILPFGVYSDTGLGDGQYVCYSKRDDEGRVVAVWIDFMFFTCNEGYEVVEPWESAQPQADKDAPKKPFGHRGGKYF